MGLIPLLYMEQGAVFVPTQRYRLSLRCVTARIGTSPFDSRDTGALGTWFTSLRIPIRSPTILSNFGPGDR